MTPILGIVQFIAISGVCVLELKHKSSAVFLWATLFVMFGVMHLIATFSGSGYGDNVLNSASLFVIAFCALYAFTRKCMLINRSDLHKSALDGQYKKKFSHRILLIVFVFAALAYSAGVVVSQGGIMDTSWAGGREGSANRSYFSGDQLLSALYAGLAGIGFVCLLEKKLGYFFLFSFAVLVVLVITRNRVLMLPLVVSVIAYYLSRKRGRITPSFIVGVVALTFLVIYFVYAVRAFRWMGTLGNALDSFSFEYINSQVLYFLNEDDGELGLRNYFYYFISKDNNLELFGEMHTYIRMLLVYVPTQLSFGVKPDDFAQTMAAAVGGDPGGSIHPTLFGDCYANAGFLGFLLGIFWGLFANVGDWVVGKLSRSELGSMAYVTFGFAYVVMGRGAVYNGFVDIAWGVPALIIVAWLISSFSKRAPYGEEINRATNTPNLGDKSRNKPSSQTKRVIVRDE